MNSLLITGPRDAAEAWARGEIGDREYILDFPRVPEAVLIATLPNIASFRRALPQLLSEWQDGADTIIFRTNTPAVCRHAQKWGCTWTVREPEEIGGKFRFILRPEACHAYLGRIAQNSAAASPVTTAR